MGVFSGSDEQATPSRVPREHANCDGEFRAAPGRVPRGNPGDPVPNPSFTVADCGIRNGIRGVKTPLVYGCLFRDTQ